MARDGAGFLALSPEPWLRLVFEGAPPAGWIRLLYRASFLDPLIRPILRMRGDDRQVDEYPPAAMFGRGEWLGYAPDDTREYLVSPVARAGPFGFEIESCEPLPRRERLARAARRDAERLAGSLIARVRGMRVEAIEQMSHAIGFEPMAHYDSWRRARIRPFDINGLDYPRLDWRATPHVRLVIDGETASDHAIHALLKALDAQPYPRCSLAVLGDAASHPSARVADAIARGRLTHVDAKAPARALALGLDDHALVGRIGPGDETPAGALAILAEHAAANPLETMIYGDEDRIDGAGRHRDPAFKPDWSPLFEQGARYVGAAAFIRAAALARCEAPARDFANPDSRALDFLPDRDARVGHVRRLLLSRAVATRPLSIVARAAPPVRTPDALPLASVVILTRDRLDLLRPCVASLFAKAGNVPFEIIIVDNGSARRATLDYLDALASDGRVRVLRRPEPFNFARFCNDGASIARSETLVFLNNDTEALSDNWLSPLVDLAQRPEAGAVGAKLLFPSGCVQHAGVVVGLFGRADHIGGRSSASDPGYLGQLAVAREVSAVTGACLAVSKSKFNAVGGFDAVNLPVDLNDIDLCLRLAERGLTNYVTPESVLTHHESATRGIYAQPSRKYARERAYFAKRWGHVMRDDPCFHPALSRHALKPSLG